MKAEGPRSAGMKCSKAKRTQLLLLLLTAETDGARRQSNCKGCDCLLVSTYGRRGVREQALSAVWLGYTRTSAMVPLGLVEPVSAIASDASPTDGCVFREPQRLMTAPGGVANEDQQY